MENKGIKISGGGSINTGNLAVGDNAHIQVNNSTSKTFVEKEDSTNDDAKNEKSGTRKVFISYNHKDIEIVDRIRNSLNLSNIEIIIDSEMMLPGESITNFIERSISKSDITLSIISNTSLLSSWVGFETINTFYLEKFSNKKFIACYIEGDFLDNEFRITATKNIDEKLGKIDSMILEYMNLKLDTSDLNNEKTRLFQLRNNLGDILQRLRNSLCLDMKEDAFDNNIKRLISAII